MMLMFEELNDRQNCIINNIIERLIDLSSSKDCYKDYNYVINKVDDYFRISHENSIRDIPQLEIPFNDMH